MILNDQQIARRAMSSMPMIDPFTNTQMRVDRHGRRIISYGLSSFGYDIRIADRFSVFQNRALLVDPLDFDTRCYDSVVVPGGERLIVPPHSYALGVSMERFQIPDDVVGICVGKSTYARCGIIVNVTPLEPGWRGYLTIEIANTTGLPAAVYPGQGIAQILFFQGDRPNTTYGDRAGKYQDQTSEPIPART